MAEFKTRLGLAIMIEAICQRMTNEFYMFNKLQTYLSANMTIDLGS